jgi:hypothetical protein
MRSRRLTNVTSSKELVDLQWMQYARNLRLGSRFQLYHTKAGQGTQGALPGLDEARMTSCL